MPLSTPATPASPSPRSALHSSFVVRSQAFFRAILDVVFALFDAVARHYLADPSLDHLKTIGRASECLVLLVALEITWDLAPQRVTPRQICKLAAAADLLARLTGRSFDFTPWTSLPPDQLAAFEPAAAAKRPATAPPAASTPEFSSPAATSSAIPTPACSTPAVRPASPVAPRSIPRPRIARQFPRPRLQRAHPAPRSAFRAPHPALRPASGHPPVSLTPALRAPHSALRASSDRGPALLPNPGATLARLINKLARILPPGFDPQAVLAQAAVPAEADSRINHLAGYTGGIPSLIDRFCQDFDRRHARPAPAAPASTHPPP